MENNNSNPLKLFWISTTQVIFSLLVLMACPIWGQAVKKKDLTPEDYKLWYHITPPKLKNDGSWFSFHKYYKSGEDTLVIQNIQNNVQMFVGNGTQEQFLENSDRLLYLSNNKLIIKNLKTGLDSLYQNGVDYRVSPNEKYLAVLGEENTGDGKQKIKSLTINAFGKSSITAIANIMEYYFDDTGKYMAFSQKTDNGYQLGYLNLEKKDTPKTILKNSVNPFTKIVWGTDGHLACFEEVDNGKNNIVHWFDVKSKKNGHGSFNTIERVQLSDSSKVVNNISTTLQFSPDNKMLFFHIQKIPNEVPETNHGSKVQIWNTKDLVIYPTYGVDKSFASDLPIMVSLNLDNNKIHFMGDRQCAQSVWGNEAKFVYSFSFFEDQSMGRNKTPIKVFNTATGEERFVMDQPFKIPWHVSPTENYLCYFKDGNWWIYSAEINIHHNLTKGIPESFLNKSDLKAGQINPYGLAGWTENENEVLLYDEHDIWAISTEGKRVKKLTDGKKEQLVFRLSQTHAGKNTLFGYTAQNLDLKKNLILRTSEKNSARTGLYELVANGSHNKIVLDDFRISNIMKSDNNFILYTLESFDQPPAIYCYNPNTNSNIKVFQSNPQHFDYNWGEKEMVEYKTEDGKTLQGALFYPSNFDPSKKYPMITYIYEKKSYTYNQYVNPSLYNGAVINSSNYTADGYFIFCPDIEYMVNEPMVSALNCVTAAVKEVSKMPFIDKNRIGLFGHSFGGFEVSYIAGRSNLFATVVSASGVHNLRSFHLSNAWLWSRPQMGRFFNDQFRFDAPYFEIPQKYEENSPLTFAESINVPFLTMTGDQDSNINWEQSLEMYNALRILNKEHIMLIYPGEGHDLFSREAQLDATQKYNEWFGYYLKNEKRPQWMEAFN